MAIVYTEYAQLDDASIERMKELLVEHPFAHPVIPLNINLAQIGATGWQQDCLEYNMELFDPMIVWTQQPIPRKREDA